MTTGPQTIEACSADYVTKRAQLLQLPGPPTAERRRALSALTDGWLRTLFASAAPDPTSLALVAVGGYGRGTLSPGSDLDLLLLHEDREDVGAIADALWYPLWDSGVPIDHAVRTPTQARSVAAGDLPALLGLLDVRLVAGDAALAASTRTVVLADWRRCARRRLPALRESCVDRGRRVGSLAFDLEPDLKEGEGGLRDVACLRAVAASWVVDRPHGALDVAAETLLDVRDALHLVTGRATDRLVLQEQDAVATRLRVADADSVLTSVARAARVVSYASGCTWHRVQRELAAPRGPFRSGRRRAATPLAPGVLELGGDVVLAPGGHADPMLGLRAAVAAATNGLRLPPETVQRLASFPSLPEPWPPAARDLLVTLLGAGPGLGPVWEALDQEGLLTTWIPEWARVRNRPQRTAAHRWTVDRHLVETVVHAAALARRVARPDLLVLAALLHDIGKGRRHGDHAVEGARLTRIVLARLGFPEADVTTVELLVRHHLLIVESATRRDHSDPRTVAAVVDAVRSPDVLELLHALTEADAVATGTGVWTDWRAGLVSALVRACNERLRGLPAPSPAPPSAEEVRAARDADEERDVVLDVSRDVAERGDSWIVRVAVPDQRGLVAATAGVLALHRLGVRAADMRTVDFDGRGVAIDTWFVAPERGDPPDAVRLREDLRRALAGGFDVATLLDKRATEGARRRPAPVAPPQVVVVADASETATVLEVRAHDRPGLLHRLGRALSLAGLDIRAARVATLGAEAVDVFYVTDERGRALADTRARETARILRDVAG